MVAFDPDDLSRFDDFRILTTSYKQVHDHEISVNVLYHKDLPTHASAAQPIIIRFHGGGLVAADSLFPDFFGHWLLDLAKTNRAIIVSANHRLLPESNATDILEDLDDLWSWVRESLPSFLTTQSGGSLGCDTGRIMVAGESAGGYLAIQLALNHPDKIRTFLIQYPMLDMKSPWFMAEYEKNVLGVPQLPRTLIADHLKRVHDSEVQANKKIIVSSDPRFERGPLMFGMIQQGLFGQYFDPQIKRLFPIDRVEEGESLPAAGGLIWHGQDDSVVPVGGSVKFRDAVLKQNPSANVALEIRPGEHGFDATVKLGWLNEDEARAKHNGD
ncbi:hypothetical protein B0A52_02319 [Exophiala mesophila]|uniref:Alpha/beta hydrolase fold-3 domain-containing protein n=1 Tax=Exophiala mesophila TaxID=212818 RepID=A0A438NBP4_EXOME|nr:hypothetical protein B0A52_02319 [Exophiala mesophila]